MRDRPHSGQTMPTIQHTNTDAWVYTHIIILLLQQTAAGQWKIMGLLLRMDVNKLVCRQTKSQLEIHLN